MAQQRKTGRSVKRLGSSNAIPTSASGTTVLINYSFELKILEVEFTEGRVYHYKEVPPDIWEQYKSWVEEGHSSGEFVNKYIKPFYDAVQLNA